MDSSFHDLGLLFSQLGLPDTEQDIDTFVQRHLGLASDVPLAQASFWTPSQAGFIRQAISDDADWSEVVDQLDSRLRLRH